MDNQEINSVAETISQEIHTSPMVLESRKSYKLIFTIVGVLILFILITG